MITLLAHTLHAHRDAGRGAGCGPSDRCHRFISGREGACGRPCSASRSRVMRRGRPRHPPRPRRCRRARCRPRSRAATAVILTTSGCCSGSVAHGCTHLVLLEDARQRVSDSASTWAIDVVEILAVEPHGEHVFAAACNSSEHTICRANGATAASSRVADRSRGARRYRRRSDRSIRPIMPPARPRGGHGRARPDRRSGCRPSRCR